MTTSVTATNIAGALIMRRHTANVSKRSVPSQLVDVITTARLSGTNAIGTHEERRDAAATANPLLVAIPPQAHSQPASPSVAADYEATANAANTATLLPVNACTAKRHCKA